VSAPKKDILDSICNRALYLATQMIFQANHRKDKEKGDPKVGGHPAASSSPLHILGALHLVVKSGFDFIANKPHASPADHAFNYMLDLFLKEDLSKLTQEEKDQAMMGLRAFSKHGEPVFQSYHSPYDSDHHGFLPSGTVGIPAVNVGYLALAYRYAQKHGYKVPKAHFWAVIGDAEFREGSLFEAVPDFAERELGNITWILDYNRQGLDGHRITNTEIMGGTDAHRVEGTMSANGWEVIQVRHGRIREKLFTKPEGSVFKDFLEDKVTDYELQSLLLLKDPKDRREGLLEVHPPRKDFLKGVKDDELYNGFRDFGGHDIEVLIEAMEASKRSKDRPTIIIAHTIKGWGLKMAASQGNHSALPHADEVEELRKQHIKGDQLFANFEDSTPEAKFLKQRGEDLYKEIKAMHSMRSENQEHYKARISELAQVEPTLDINLKMASYPHTQWMLGQLTAKLTRIANTPLQETELSPGQKPLTDDERPWKIAGELLVSMAPDVGTSTNLNPAMDGKIFGAVETEDYESQWDVKDSKLPDLVPGMEENDRFLRFDIAEGTVMSCMGSFGKIRDYLGIPLLPLMTVYDFFLKRALDQLFYDLYWRSSFILVGTPSGITLSSEGAQHGWKSDLQIPNQITWEPFFCQELDWILSDAVQRHFTGDNVGRTGVIIRGVTRGVEQRDLMRLLKRQARFKVGMSQGELLCLEDFKMEGAKVESEVQTLPEQEIMNVLKQEVLSGAYPLIDYRGYAGYEPGDNVVHIFSMGSPTTEAIKASEELLKKGIYANVFVVTSTDLLLGNLGHANDYSHLKNGLGVNSDLHLIPVVNGNAHQAELVTLSGRRVPIVSVHDGEPGLLDNIGSIIGVRQETLATRKHSKSGRPSDIYEFHNLDSRAIIEAAGKALADTALEGIKVSRRTLEQAQERALSTGKTDWKNLWD
jgi:pyruvate dehydrogenase E1 component